MSPFSSIVDMRDCLSGHLVLLCDNTGGSGAFKSHNFPNLSFTKNGKSIGFPTLRSAMNQFVGAIIFVGSPANVLRINASLMPIAAIMGYLVALRRLWPISNAAYKGANPYGRTVKPNPAGVTVLVPAVRPDNAVIGRFTKRYISDKLKAASYWGSHFAPLCVARGVPHGCK